jgi:flagellar assembly protein FliH
MRLQLEVFESSDASTETPVMTLDTMAFEEAKLTAYDKGYRAGWDDAVQAQSDGQDAISAELARNLKTLGFTFQEARGHVLQSLRPLLHEMVARLLPEIARDTIAPIALQVLMPLADAAADAPMELVIHPSARVAITHLLAATDTLPLTLIDEPSLGEGQAFLRLSGSETQIDLDGAITDISAAIRNFYDLPERMSQDG